MDFMKEREKKRLSNACVSIIESKEITISNFKYMV